MDRMQRANEYDGSPTIRLEWKPAEDFESTAAAQKHSRLQLRQKKAIV